MKMAKKIVPILTLIGALALGGNAYAQNRNTSDSGSKDLETKVEQVIDTFTLPSVRAGYEGVPFTYEVLVGKDGLYARRKDEPQTTFLLSAFYDIDSNGLYGSMENKLIKSGIPMHMTKIFTDKVLEAYTNYIKNQNQTAQTSQLPPALLTPLPILPPNYNVPNKPGEKPDVSLMAPETGGYNEKVNLPAPEAPAKQDTQAPKIPETQEQKNNLELIIDGSGAPEVIGGRIGLRGKLAGMFGMGVSLSGAYGFPETIDSVTTSPSPTGRYFSGSIVNENRIKLGADLEFYLGDDNGSLFFGAGPVVWIYGQKTTEQLLDSSNNVVKTNSNEELKTTLGVDAYLGYNIKWFRFLVGWDSFNKFYAETGVSLPIGTDKKQ